ncbi:hypothetical protein ARMGADRAFT_946047, partial [Armillaria gallica]
QEFRELELLDHITSLLYNNHLPSTVFSKRRYDLLTRFQYHVGEAFISPAVESSIAWGPYDPVHPTNCCKFKLDVKSMPHIPVRIMCNKDKDLHLMGPQQDSPVLSYGKSISNNKHSVHALGCKWYNNSCPYDSILFVLANTWKSDPVHYAKCFKSINIEWMGELSKSLQLHIEGKYSLEQVRDFMRQKLH